MSGKDEPRSYSVRLPSGRMGNGGFHVKEKNSIVSLLRVWKTPRRSRQGMFLTGRWTPHHSAEMKRIIGY